MNNLLVAMLLVCAPVYAQENPKGKVEIRGLVYKPDGSPLQGIAIEIMGLRRECRRLSLKPVTVKSDVRGRFYFRLPRGVDVLVRIKRVVGMANASWLEVPDSDRVDFTRLKASQRNCQAI